MTQDRRSPYDPQAIACLDDRDLATLSAAVAAEVESRRQTVPPVRCYRCLDTGTVGPDETRCDCANGAAGWLEQHLTHDGRTYHDSGVVFAAADARLYIDLVDDGEGRPAIGALVACAIAVPADDRTRGAARSLVYAARVTDIGPAGEVAYRWSVWGADGRPVSVGLSRALDHALDIVTEQREAWAAADQEIGR